MTGDAMWAMCAVRDAIREGDPALWNEICFMPLGAAMDKIQTKYGVILADSEIEAGALRVLNALGVGWRWAQRVEV